MTDIWQPDAADSRRATSLRLAIVARRLRMRFDERVQKSGITRANWTVVAAAARIPDATQKSIADALQISEVSAGRMIDRLCRDGLLLREPCATDRRAYRISVTDKADPLLRDMGVLAAVQEAEAFAGISAEELRLFAEILSRIEANLDQGAGG